MKPNSNGHVVPWVWGAGSRVSGCSFGSGIDRLGLRNLGCPGRWGGCCGCRAGFLGRWIGDKVCLGCRRCSLVYYEKLWENLGLIQILRYNIIIVENLEM